MAKDSIDIVLPTDQSEGTSNTVGKWFKAVGDPVRKDDPLLEIVTDKVTVEIAAPGDGVLSEILKPEGESVEPGDIVGRIGSGVPAPSESRSAAEPVPPKAGTSPQATDQAAELSPAVRRLLQQHGLDASAIKGTGRGGRITVHDVERFVEEAATQEGARELGSKGVDGPSGRRVPHTQIRKSIAEHMVRSMRTAPHVTAVFEADLSAVTRHRQAQSTRATYTAYFVQASVAALEAVPAVNSRWHDDALELFDDCNIGVAVALPSGGLIVPVLHKAQELDLAETARRLQDLTTRARDGKLEPKEVQGGTFTISNHGVSGSLLAAPIVINQPQSAILGVGKMEDRAKLAVAGGFEARPCAYVTLTIDHRVLDGFQANAFLTKWVETIEGWA
jgi:2-oxoglutarate dehydrogenase E2 component (dihydrolipoamide succinyltransferase)